MQSLSYIGGGQKDEQTLRKLTIRLLITHLPRHWCRAGLCILALAGAGCEPAPEAGRGPRAEPVASVVMGHWVNGDPGPLRAPEFRQALQDFGAWAGVEQSGYSLSLLVPELATEPDIVVVALSLQHFEPVLLGSAEDGFATLTGAAAARDAAFVVGSPFVEGYSPLRPLGLMQLNGVTVSPVQPHGYTRILGLSSESMGVVHRGSFHRGLFESALQVGPGIVEAGQLDINPTETRLPAYLRTFVGTCGDQVLLGASLRPIHLYELGQRLLAHTVSQGLVCDELANLSGDRETLLVLPVPSNGSQRLYYGNLEAPKTALIGFQRRPSSR